RLRRAPKTRGAGRVQVAARRVAPVAGDRALVPAQVVDRRHVREEAEVELVAQVEAGLHEPCRIDDERRLPMLFDPLHHTGDRFVPQLATPRISYAGGTPALIFSCRRTMPSSSASGRGVQPGTCTSTATILSTP